MKVFMAGMLAVAMLIMAGSAMAYEIKEWDDYSWWAQRESTPRPVKDAVRSGYWWWPTEPDSNVDDQELWGNRGVVYHIWEPPVETPPPAPPEPTPPPVKKEIIKPVLNNVLFDFDKSVLKPEGKAETGKVVSFMGEYPESTVLIEGHTDSIGTDAYNMALGQRRADSVKSYMVENGISDARITTKSYGESQPVVPNTSRANRALNRRAVFNIMLPNE